MTLQWSYAIAAFWLGAATTVAQQGAATAEPTATHVASYSLAEVGLILSKAYLQHGGLDLVGSSVYGVDVYTVEYSTTELPGTPYAGNPTQMTGVIMVPNRKELDLPVAAHIHETTTLGTSVPSMAFANCGSDDTGDSRRERRESLARERHERVFEEMMGSATSTFGSICLPDTYICPIAMWGGIATASMG